MESEEVSGGNAAVVNFYTELGLDRTWAVDQLQAKLQKLKLHWGRRASLAGKHGDEARERLSVIESALNTFSDEDAKERYDYRLRHADSVVSDDEVNWVARAWTYYFAEDYDAAVVAARKARERGSSDPAAYVVSAWIELAQYQAERALEYASEAYVLDENGDNAFEVQEVRGVVFYAMKKYDRAIEAFKKAADTASSTQKPGVCLRLARAQTQRSRHKEALSSCLTGLETDKYNQHQDALIRKARANIYKIINCGATGSALILTVNSTKQLIADSEIGLDIKQLLNDFVDKVYKMAVGEPKPPTRPTLTLKASEELLIFEEFDVFGIAFLASFAYAAIQNFITLVITAISVIIMIVIIGITIQGICVRIGDKNRKKIYDYELADYEAKMTDYRLEREEFHELCNEINKLI